MSSSTLAILIACISGAVSLVTAFGVERLHQRTDNAKLAQDEKLANLKRAQDEELEKFRSESAIALEEARDQRARALAEETKDEEARRVISKYRDPLLRSAYDLQSRIYNVYRPGGFKGGRDPEYFRLNTMFLFAEFFAWLEIIRREIQFLDLGAAQATKDLSTTLQEVQDQMATTSELRDDFYLYRGHQRAIGELMIAHTNTQVESGPRYECMGYAAFVAAQNDPVFTNWFTRLGDAIGQLPESRPERLVWVQHALINLIDLLDPEHDRFGHDRGRLPEPESSIRRPSRRPKTAGPLR